MTLDPGPIYRIEENMTSCPTILVIPTIVICLLGIAAWKYKAFKAPDIHQSNMARGLDSGRQDTHERVYTESRYDHGHEEQGEEDPQDDDHQEQETGGEKDYATDGFVAQRDVAITEGADDKKVYEERTERDRAMVREWLTQKVKLPQYYDVLVNNGYDSLDIVQEITMTNELKEIGIVLKGHVLKLMTEIKRLADFVELTNPDK
eukprot:134999_1